MKWIMAGRQLAALVLSDAERTELTSLAARRSTAQALGCGRGSCCVARLEEQNKEVAADLQIDQTTVGKWRRRFAEHRIDGLCDEPRSGTPPRD
jgi:transposase-like protein